MTDLIQGNDVTHGTAGSYGVWVFVPYLDVTVDNNTVTDSDIGLGLLAATAETVNFTGNTVDLTAPRGNSIGALVSTTTWYWGEMNVSASFSGSNSISNADYGLYIEQNPTTANATTTVSSGGRHSGRQRHRHSDQRRHGDLWQRQQRYGRCHGYRD